MTPIKFKQQTQTFSTTQNQYLSMPAHVDQDKIVTSCWKGSPRERLAFLFTGKLWLQTMTFGTRLQPIKPSMLCPLASTK